VALGAMKTVKKHTNFRFIDLFARIGGFRLALENHGGECVFSSEIDKKARDTYFSNFHDEPAGDICGVDAKSIPDHDILCGGFPCQAFSMAGKKKGFDDTRGTLFREVTRILKEKRPSAFLLENVANLQRHDKGRTLKVIR
jgi:DNA (cytosine-5)-methyltransferase 1